MTRIFVHVAIGEELMNPAYKKKVKGYSTCDPSLAITPSQSTAGFVVTHIPTGIRIAGAFSSPDIACKIAGAISRLDVPWDSSDAIAIDSAFRKTPREIRAWARTLQGPFPAEGKVA